MNSVCFLIATLIFVLSLSSCHLAYPPERLDHYSEKLDRHSERLDRHSERIQSSNLLLETLANQNIQGYKRAEKVIDFVFPQDHFAHPGFKTEWWYFTGNLSAKGRDFGYQFTIFRNNIDPAFNETKLSAWDTNQIYMAHLGLSDLGDKQFYSFEKYERSALGLAGIQKPFRLWLDNWQVRSLGDLQFFPIEIEAYADGIGYKLKLSPSKKITLQGDRGLSHKGNEPGNASYYYSITKMKTEGQVFIKGKSYEVQGYSWMDREWSTSALAKDQEGWDWFALQLDNDIELMYYQLRNQDGSISALSAGSIVDSNSLKQSFAAEDVEVKVLNYFQSAGHRYPVEWQFKLPEYGLDLLIKARMQDQEHKFAINYWEGAVEIEGSYKGTQVKGLGYVELTGY